MKLRITATFVYETVPKGDLQEEITSWEESVQDDPHSFVDLDDVVMTVEVEEVKDE